MKVGGCCSPTFYVVEGGKHMKCLCKYKWVKLPRMHLPGGKGLMGYWAKLASRAAFRKGNAVYCGHINPVTAGMWSGSVVGLKSILGVKRGSGETLNKGMISGDRVLWNRRSDYSR